MVDLIPDRPEIPALPATDSRMTHDEGQRTSQRLALKLAYDGTDFAGWQRQPGERTVQGELERIFGALAGDREVSVVAAGRTDSGVHASGQVAHVDLPVGRAEPEGLLHSVRRMVPADLAVGEIVKVESDFHARYRARRRTYRYTVALRQNPFFSRYRYLPYRLPDVDRLRSLAPLFLGRHDFTGFSKHNPDTPNTVCEIELAEWERFDDRLEFTLRADRFLYSMVRMIVGAQLAVEAGRRAAEEIVQKLADPDRMHPFVPVPGHGLSLIAVSYPAPIFQTDCTEGSQRLPTT